MSTKQDDYLQTQLAQILQPGEQVLHAAYMRRQPGLLMQILLVGGLLLFLMTKAYFVVLTNRRLLLIRTNMSFWTGGPQLLNLGLEQHDAQQIQQVTVSGFANNRSMTFHMGSGAKETLRISPWFKQISGTKAFFDEVPRMVSSGQLAQLGAGQGAYGAMPQQAGGYGAQQQQQGGYGAPQQHQQQPAQGGYGAPQQQQQQPAQGGYGAPQQQQQPAQGGYGAPPQQQQQQQPAQGGYGAPPQQGAYAAPPPQAPAPAQGGFAPGSRIQFTAQDGNRYPATFVQEQNGHVLCAMPDGQQHWIPAQNVSPG